MNENILKNISIIILLISSLDFIYSKKNFQKNISSVAGLRFCGADQMKIKISKQNYYSPENLIKIKKRKLDNIDYKPIRIFLDTTYIISQGENSTYLKNMISKSIKAMNKSISTFEKLLKVIPLNNTIKFGLDKAKDRKIGKISKSLLFDGVSADLVIFPRLADEGELPDLTLANAGAIELDIITSRPVIGIVNINRNLDFSIVNSIDYLESILLHEFTHILGFSYSLFYYFPGGINETVFYKNDKRLRLNRTYVKTKKLVETAKKYFNCSKIEGVELENQGGEGTAGSHWEARILLGEYMNGNLYLIEQVISEFTLALLEDSGWYKVNYYTGGLMRFGKYKGCQFIEEDCINSTTLETKFSNDFFNIMDNFYPRCSSGRQSRGYNLLYIINSVENEEYLRFGNKLGYITADYCPICQEYSVESKELYYIGNCQKGTYDYGTMINFGYRLGYENEEIPEILGEKFSQNSFCSLTSVIPKSLNNKYNIYKKTHPACYPMFCSEKSLTIQIKEQYIVCPRKGGKISISKNYEGYIYCPDYNLICTGTVMCNNMIDCVEKESLIKNNTYDYDYIINNSQDFDEIESSDILIGYELSTDGICPQNCIQCLSNKKCFQCLNGYKLIGKKENDLEPIICSNTIDISSKYYKNGDIYYECIKDCEKCSSGNGCDKCVKNKKVDSSINECIDLVDNCEKYDDKENCIACNINYAFIGDDRAKCIDISNKTIFDIDKFYTEDKGTSFYPCDTYIKNCDKCSKKDECNICVNEYVILDNNKSNCIKEEELISKKTSYKIDEFNYKSCNKAINNCITCNSENYCLSCENTYGIINDIFNECISLKGKENKYYLDESNGVYYNCNKNMPNCETCTNKNSCISCGAGYKKDPYNKCVNESLLLDFFINEHGNFLKCSDSINNCKYCSSKDFCNYCNYNFSILNDKRNECLSDNAFKGNNNYYTFNNGINYYSCDFQPDIKGIGNCSECEIDNEILKCVKCNDNFAFLDNNFQKCYDIEGEIKDKIKENYIYKDDLNYFTCSFQIENCTKCENDKKCLECFEDNAFVNDDFSKCYSKENFKVGYYSKKNGTITIYYPCLENCGECDKEDICEKCIDDFAFIGESRNNCINTKDKDVFDIKKYYTEDNGISYFPCDTVIKNCDECSTKNECNKCNSQYIILDDNTFICLSREEYDNSKTAYKIDEYNYKSCNKSMNNCITCNSENYCLSCKEGYGIIDDIHSKCESLEDKEKKIYYDKEKGIYYTCNKSLNYCKECSDKDTCTLCDDIYILPYEESKCIDIDKNMAYYFYDQNANNFKKCNYGVKNCLKCSSENSCNQCEKDYTLFNNNTKKCELKSLYENNDNYITLDNGINYYECGKIIENCSKCKLNSEKKEGKCITCNKNFALLDNNYSKCYNLEEELSILINNKEIFTNDNGINYFSCNKYINNCNKCENEYNCLLCSPEYAFLEEDNAICYLKSNFKIGYYSDKNKTRFYYCLSNCENCKNKTICEKCSDKYMPNENDTGCQEKIVNIKDLEQKCILDLKNISNEDFELIIKNNKFLNEYITEYQKMYINNNYAVVHYTNDKYKFSLTIFKYSECSTFLVEKGNQKISTDNLMINLGKSLNNNLVYIQAFAQYENKISFSLYNSKTCEKIEIPKNCRNCDEFQIVNNYTDEITNYIGNNILHLIQNENIDFFNEEEKIFNDICTNLTINNIDYPINERKSKFYLGSQENKNIIICGDVRCTVIEDNNNNSTSICNCPIDNSDNLGYLFISQDVESIYENNLTSSTNNINDNMIYIFKCIQNGFKSNKIKNNLGFYISIIGIGVVILCYIVYLTTTSSDSLKKIPLSPPKKTIHNEEENNNSIYNISEKQSNINIKEIKNQHVLDITTETDKNAINIPPPKEKNKKSDLDIYLDYLSLKEAIKDDKRSFCYYYCHLLFFNQLILNLISCCSCNIAESFIPFPIKLMKFIFLYLIGLFINAILTTNKYILNKYNYFNGKYDIENNDINPSLNEKVIYSISNGLLNIIISFCICLFLQYLLGCALNVRRTIGNIILKEDSKSNERHKINIRKIQNSMICKFNTFFILCLLILIVIFLYLTNYCAAYSGMVVDIISQSVMSFIILQICPFFVCFLISCFRYMGLNCNCQLFFMIDKCLSGL